MKRYGLFVVLFFGYNISYAQGPLSVGATNQDHPCHQFVLQNVCLVNKVYNYDQNVSEYENFINQKNEEECLSGSDVYAKHLYDIFPLLPEHAKNAFCHTRNIYIVKDFPVRGMVSGGYEHLASSDLYDTDTNKLIALSVMSKGYDLFLNAKLFFETGDEDRHATEAHQRLFGLFIEDGDDISGFPVWKNLNKSENPLISSSLYSVLLHEIGHMAHFGLMASNQNMVIKFNSIGKAWAFTGARSQGGGLDEAFVSRLPRHLQPVKFDRNGILVPRYNIDLLEEILDEVQKSFYPTLYGSSNFLEDFAEFYVSAHTRSFWTAQKNGKLVFNERAFRDADYNLKENIIMGLSDDIFELGVSSEVGYIYLDPNSCGAFLSR